MPPSLLLCKPPPSPSPPQLASNHTRLPGRSPSPPLRDVGPITNATSKRRSLDPGRIRPTPLQRDIGGSWSTDGGVGDGETQWGTQEVGGPFSAS